MMVAWKGIIMQESSRSTTARLPRKSEGERVAGHGVEDHVAHHHDERDHHAVDEKADEGDVVPDVDVVVEMHVAREEGGRVGEDVVAGDARPENPVERHQHGRRHDERARGGSARSRRRMPAYSAASTAPASPPDTRLAAQVTARRKQEQHHGQGGRVVELAQHEARPVNVGDQELRRVVRSAAGHHVDQVEAGEGIDDAEDEAEEERRPEQRHRDAQEALAGDRRRRWPPPRAGSAECSAAPPAG